MAVAGDDLLCYLEPKKEREYVLRLFLASLSTRVREREREKRTREMANKIL